MECKKALTFSVTFLVDLVMRKVTKNGSGRTALILAKYNVKMILLGYWEETAVRPRDLRLMERNERTKYIFGALRTGKPEFD